MQRKAVFLDVDGTLVNDRGLIPHSAQQAVAIARASGHRVFLATGRSLPELWPEIMAVGFDGVIAAAGGYVEVAGRVIHEQHVPVDEVRRVVEYFHANAVEYFLESNSGLFGSPGCQSKLRQSIFGGVVDEDVLAELERGLGGFIASIVVGADPLRNDINKILFLDTEVPLEDIRAQFCDAFDLIPSAVPMFGRSSGELTLKGVHKATGIERAIDHLDIDRADTLAFGDGLNDIEMIQFVGVGVAMGNAHPSLKRVADDLTDTVDEDGIHAGFLRHGLLG